MQPVFPQRASVWRLRTQSLTCGPLPLLMGIINVTPDSFSDGGKFLNHQRAIEHGLRLEDEGAAILDVGGESTRPYSQPVSVTEELERVMPVVEQLCRRCTAPVSIDTTKSHVAQLALEAGAEIVNDISGLSADSGMIPLVARSGAGVCAMHMQGTPATMQDRPTYRDVVEEIFEYLAQRRDVLLQSGVAQERICLDPGIGFGKTHQHNLTLMANCHRFHTLGQPLLVGHSRKGFIAKVLGRTDNDRVAGVIGASISLACQGIQVLRVHDVLAVGQAMKMFAACGGLDGQPWQLPAT